MDIFAHTLWANAGARAGNKLAAKKNSTIRISPAWTGFFGVVPDFFAFTIPFAIIFYKLIFTSIPGRELFGKHAFGGAGFDLAAYLYQYSHSLVVWAVVFALVWAIYKRPRYELLGWALHILIDIFSHTTEFYPTPFLFPLSEYRFIHGVSWGGTVYMLVNYTLLLVIWGSIYYNKHKINKQPKDTPHENHSA